ncbi:MAG TPA: zinc-dependent metalloprotease family protein [Flavisolibacter sp.]
MARLYRVILPLFLILSSFSSFGQSGFFSDEGAAPAYARRVIRPDQFRLVTADVPALKDFLWNLPREASVDRNTAPVILLPMPDGQMARFRVWESSIQEKGLEQKFPEIRTFTGQGIDDPYATVRMDFNPYFGFHAQVLTIMGSYYIDPYARGNTEYYMSYFRKDITTSYPFTCSTDESSDGSTHNKVLNVAAACRGTQLYTYRLAVACTGEYAVAVGGSTPAALHAAIVTTVNRVVGVYEKELAIRMILVDNNDLIEFMTPSSDPFTGNNNASVLISESQSVITANIGTANFDIGHTFSTGGGGLAGLGVVCNSSSKARGITGRSVPIGDPFDIDYVAHEMGHQFGGSHTFNGSGGSCNGNRSASNAYEPGSGSTIQAYAGICSSDNLQPNSDPHFHGISFDQISNFVEAGGSSCRGVIATGNNIPQITAMSNNAANIPLSTPFVLSGTATDPDGDAITYSWEQWDLGPATAWNGGATSTTAPLFKSRIPKTTGQRTFPDMAVILANYPANPAATMGGLKGETLPTVGRTMKFRLTVRDNRAGGGGVTSGGSGCQSGLTGIFQVNAVAGTGPFIVTAPNGGETITGGTTATVTWNVAGTSSAPINTSSVRITLSTDGGQTYPVVLSAGTANDGSEILAFPLVPTTQARVRIEAVGNIYFDISNNNFTITAAGTGFDFDNPAPVSAACATQASASVTLGTTSSGGFSGPISLSATGNPAGTSVSFSVNPVNPGNSTVVTLNNIQGLAAGTYNVTVNGVSGSFTKSRIVSFMVQPGSGPAITAQPQDRSVCPNFNTTFTVGAGSTSYQWQVSTDGGNFFSNISGATTSSLAINNASAALDNNRYRVLLNGQCGTTVSNAARLTVFPQPQVTLSAAPYTRLHPGLQTTITANSNPSAGVTYTWFKNSVVLPGVSGNTLPIGVAGTGTYMVQVTDANGCINQSQPITIGDSVSSQLFVYPSPNNGRFTVAYYHSGSTTARTVEIYDARGALVYRRQFAVVQRYQLLSIDMPVASRGVYFVMLKDADGKKIATEKILVH